jgi:N-acetylneuraminic acid mutarotase
MIVWGGLGSTFSSNTGGRYNPSTDNWAPMSSTNAPDARYQHTAIWTANEMIVWGGIGDLGDVNTGGRYNPGTDSWIAASTTNAPSARDSHTAVWSGTEMIVWGGWNGGSGGSTYFNTGGKYTPTTDSWTATATANAPTGRYLHTAVWNGSEMIVWGGFDNIAPNTNTGGRYSPDSDSWTATSTADAPQGRSSHWQWDRCRNDHLGRREFPAIRELEENTS